MDSLKVKGELARKIESGINAGERSVFEDFDDVDYEEEEF